jgi:hypothetical protein
MRRKHLESALSSVQREFPNPNVRPSRFVWFVVVLIHSAAAAARVGPLSISSHDLTPQLWPHYQNVCIYQKQAALEQYVTSPHLAASTILCALERQDVGPGRTVLDLGCGTGMLAIAWQVSFVLRTDGGLAGCGLRVVGRHQHLTLPKSRACVREMRTLTTTTPTTH